MSQPTAVLCGDLCMLRCFTGTNIPVLIAHIEPDDITLTSRHCRQAAQIADPATMPEKTIEDLVRIGRRYSEPPALLYGTDAMLLAISRGREQLVPYYRFLLPERQRIEDLVDKRRFAHLATQLGLPVPRTV